MRSDARKKLADRRAHALDVLATNPYYEEREEARRILAACDAHQGVCPEPIQLLRSELRMLAHQLIEDADTQHPDEYLRGVAVGQRDAARAILNTLGDSA